MERRKIRKIRKRTAVILAAALLMQLLDPVPGLGGVSASSTTQQEIGKTEKEKDNLEDELDKTQDNLNSLEGQRDSLKKELDYLNGQLAAVVANLEELEIKVGELLETIQKEMLERAGAHRDANTFTAVNMEEFERIFSEKAGFVKAMWCGNEECEVQIKDKLSVTSRCMPFAQEQIADTCVCCGRPAKKMVYWGRAY